MKYLARCWKRVIFQVEIEADSESEARDKINHAQELPDNQRNQMAVDWGVDEIEERP